MNPQKALQQFQAKHYDTSYFESAEDAAEYLNRVIDNRTVGFGDSQTLTYLRMYALLSQHNKVYDPQNCVGGKTFDETAKECLTTEIFLTSVNAASETGELVNIDGTGNRIAGSLFGHDKIYFVFGVNKLAPTLEEAVWRAQNIAAPKNAQRLCKKTPCAKRADACYHCTSPDRICGGIMIHFQKMVDVNMEIVLINEPLEF